MHMSANKQTFKQLAEITGVSYRTMLAWQKSRPELMGYIKDLQIGCSNTDDLEAEIAALNSLINSIHKQTEV